MEDSHDPSGVPGGVSSARSPYAYNRNGMSREYEFEGRNMNSHTPPSSKKTTATPTPAQHTQDQKEKEKGKEEEKGMEIERKQAEEEMHFDAPRDVVSGLGEGLKSIAIGVGSGLGTMISAPIIGARAEGPKGFAKGLGIGLAAGVAMPLVGAVTGAVQIISGCVNTPSTMKNKLEGKVWDDYQRKWILYSLQDEANRILPLPDDPDNSSSDRGRGGHAKSTARVKDMEYYDLLGVPCDATPEEIKKGYYKKALRCHPDKCPGDEEASRRFQELSKAYQLLSNDQLRAAYDAQGLGAVADQVSFVDPAIFFVTIFGSERFAPYVGELALSHKANDLINMSTSADTNSSNSNKVDLLFGSGDKKAALRQHKREINLALHLREATRGYVEGYVEPFRCWADKEGFDLAGVSYGPELLEQVGWVYKNQAEQYLGYSEGFLGLDGAGAELMNTGLRLMKKSEMVGSVVGSIRSAKAINDSMHTKKKIAGSEEKKGDDKIDGEQKQRQGQSPKRNKAVSEEKDEMSEEDMLKFQAAVQDNLPQFLDTLWKMSAIDVHNTIQSAVKKLILDRGVSRDEQKKRAEALLILGKTFLRHAHEARAIEKKTGKNSKDKEEILLRVMQAAASSQQHL